ncbi:hypothetical protein ACA910_020418 [Epithemia clementina (nom. ined.)]
MGSACSNPAEPSIRKDDTAKTQLNASYRAEAHKVLDGILNENPDIDPSKLAEALAAQLGPAKSKKWETHPSSASTKPTTISTAFSTISSAPENGASPTLAERPVPPPPLLEQSVSIENTELVEAVNTLSTKPNAGALKRRNVALKDAIRAQKTERDPSSRKILESFLTGGRESTVRPQQLPLLRASLTGDDSGSRARQILFEQVLHENDGFLSPENGFMPSTAPLQKFISHHPALKEWDALVEEVRETLLMYPSKFRARVDAMPAFPVESVNEKELLRASSVVGTIMQTYWYCGAERKQPRQDLLDAWGQVRRRLGWHVEDGHGKKYYDLPFYTLLDYSTYNWRQKKIAGHYHVDDLRADELELNVLGMPPVDNSERFFYTAMLMIIAKGAPLPLMCVEAQEAAARQDDGALANALIHICQIWEAITDEFAKINPHHGAAEDFQQTDAIIFSRLFADTAIPIPSTKVTPDGKKIVTPSTGQSVPVFQLMDCFFNRKKFTGIHGEDVERHIAAYPRRWSNFIRAIQSPDDVNTTHIDMYIRKSRNPELQGLFAHTLQIFAGDNGFLGRHLIKLYGYMTMLFRTGRQATMGGYSGHPLDRTEDKIRYALQLSQRDRFAERPGRSLRHTARLNEHAVALGSGDSSMWSVCLNLEGEGMRCSLSDHLRVLPKNMRDVGDQFCQLVMEKLGLNPDAEVQVADLPSWQEKLNYFLGENAPTIPRVGDIALYGQIRNFASPIPGGTASDITLEQLQNIVPLAARLYSISVVQNDRAGHVKFLYLTVREWKDGVASRLLVRGMPGTKIIVQVYRSHVLRRLDASRSVYFASGTGISPFTDLYSDNSYPYDQWLIWMTQKLSDDMFSDFKFVTRYNQHLTVDVLQTGAPLKRTRSGLNAQENSRFACSHNFMSHYLNAARGQRLASFFDESGSEYKKLAQWTRQGSLTVLACGNIGFVMEVVNLLRRMGVNIGQWIATGRLRVECFGSPGWLPAGQSRQLAPWEILRSALPLKYGEGEGQTVQSSPSPPLMIVGDNVYEITQNMLDIHPGGRDLIEMYQGADATQAFRVIGHDKDGNATGMLQAFEVGRFNKILPDAVPDSDGTFDLVRMGFDCSEMRNCYLIDDSLHERMIRKPSYSSTDVEIHASCAEATHERVVNVHLPRIDLLVKNACNHLCPGVNFDELVSPVEAPAEKQGLPGILSFFSINNMDTVTARDAKESEKSAASIHWKERRANDRKLFDQCVSHAADLCEEVANNGEGVKDILLAWKKNLHEFKKNM